MELLRALGSLIEEPSLEHWRLVRLLRFPDPPSPATHHRVVASQRWPYASIYLGPEGMLGGEARDRIAGFRRALKVEHEPGVVYAAVNPSVLADASVAVEASHAAAGSLEVDHLTVLLDLLAALDEWREDARTGGHTSTNSGAARRVLLFQAEATLVWEHLTPWLRPYLASFDACGEPFYEEWAALLGRVLDDVEHKLEDAGEFPERLPAALRSVPGLPDPRREGGEAFAASLVAPVRAGMILLRDDLTRFAAEAGLACRAGERRYALAGLLAQAPAETLGWLAGRTEEWRDRLDDRGPARIAQWWSSRAAASARLLSELAREATQAVPTAPAGARP